MANLVYTSYLYDAATGRIDLLNDPLYVMLLSGTYTPNTGHATVADVVTHQAVDPLGSYVSGGKAIAGRSLSLVAGSVRLMASATSWTSATITCSGAAIYYSGGASDAQKRLVSYVDLGNNSSTNGTFQITWNTTNGILGVSAS